MKNHRDINVSIQLEVIVEENNKVQRTKPDRLTKLVENRFEQGIDGLYWKNKSPKTGIMKKAPSVSTIRRSMRLLRSINLVPDPTMIYYFAVQLPE